MSSFEKCRWDKSVLWMSVMLSEV